jgi:sortase (surface protein transpeptidase)
VQAWRTPTDGGRHARRWAAVVVVLVVTALTGGVLTLVTGVSAQPTTTRSSPPSTEAMPAVNAPSASGAARAPDAVASLPVVPRGVPVRVLIPAIDADVALVRLGLRPDRAMEVPDFGLAGWYGKGPMPGHPGPAVLAGHVDSRAGPDVFFRLRDLIAGDHVHVLYDSGDRITFVVTTSERTPKDALPVASIWPLTTDRLLALITCGGTFDRDARSYRDNVIVYATPLDREVPAGVTDGTGGTATGSR